MEHEEEIMEPISPTGQYLSSSVLSLSIIAVLESEIPIDDSQTYSLLRDLFLPINTRFSSIMVGEKNGAKKWKKVEVDLKEHVRVPKLPGGMSLEYYNDYFNNYLSKLAMEQFPQNQPLWELHVFKYPTNNAPGNYVFKFHHALGDGYSLMGALLSCLKRKDNPCMPLTFPSRQSNSSTSANSHQGSAVRRSIIKVPCFVVNTVLNFVSGLLKSTIIKDAESPIRSGHPGVEFQPIAMTTMEFSLDSIKIIKNNLKVTINDVIAGVILFGIRLYMEGEKENSSSNSNANALVLLNTRNLDGYKSIDEMVKPKSEMPWGNRWAFIHLPIPKLRPTHISNPLKFVYHTQNKIKRSKNSAAVFLTGLLLDKLRKFRGPEVTSKYLANTLRNSSITMTNMIGPIEQMSVGTHPVKGLYFFVVGSPQSAVVTVMSYVGKLRIGIEVEKGLINPDKFKSCIMNAYDMTYKAAAAAAAAVP